MLLVPIPQPALPDRDGQSVAAAVYPSGDGEYRAGFLAVFAARQRVSAVRLRDPGKSPAFDYCFAGFEPGYAAV